MNPSISLEIPIAVTIFSIITRNDSRSFCAGPRKARVRRWPARRDRVVERTHGDGCAGEEPIGRIGTKQFRDVAADLAIPGAHVVDLAAGQAQTSRYGVARLQPADS